MKQALAHQPLYIVLQIHRTLLNKGFGVYVKFSLTQLLCTMTALTILTTGVLGTVDADGKLLTGATLTIEAFSSVFGRYAGTFVSFGIVFFFKNERLVTIHGLGYIDTGLCFLFSSNAYEWRISELVFYI